jgi:hypothetical protein
MRPKQLNIEVTDELYKELSVYCINNDVKKKDLVTKLIESFLKTKEEK